MKKLILASVLVVVAALFTACGGAGSPSEETGTVYVSEIDEGGKITTNTWTFNADGTFLITSFTSSVTTPWDVFMGTYTGDASQDGTITIAFTKLKHSDGWHDIVSHDYPTSITITNGRFECGYVCAGAPFIRQ